MRKEELTSVGFSHRYKPALKGIDKNCLGYGYLFKAGNSISIDLMYIEHLDEWKVSYVRFEGESAFKLLKENLKGYDSESVVEFVKKFPSQTF
ncbi:hypothetical protein KIM67_12795 [Flagellimonas sp. 389]|uniref:hypothetical protein n=1 Tax=Flagellimonas sp. 389 TaxID=2835862 RepID=UPI001BD31072|nr:hypothetical protein [Flagellimonas sp. 389]MBS9463288.1 hypothetical protein [Flagellimonas sp. 389]